MSKNHTVRLAALRDLLKQEGVDGFILPSADEYQGEYTPPCAARLAWLSGFDGSAGVVIVLPDRAGLFVPALYEVQARHQTDPALFETVNIRQTPAADWLAAHAVPGARIGYDARLHTTAQIGVYGSALESSAVTLVPMTSNPVDLLWSDRPLAPASAVELFPDSIAGRSSAEKRALIAETLRKKGAQAFVMTMPDSIAWMLNIRARDLEHVPVALSYALVDALVPGRVQWFIAQDRVGAEIRAALGKDVVLRAPSEFMGALTALGDAARAAGKPVAFDLRTAPIYLRAPIEAAGAKILDLPDPCVEPRACKTPSEQAAMIETHRRDGLAVVRALARLARACAQGAPVTEMTVSDIFYQCRAMDPAFRGTSFETIAAFGPHAAMPHYRPTPQTDTPITDHPVAAPGILLIDSGGLYLGADYAGTTDITRTIAIGTVPEEIRRNNTRVLKGHIAVARARFPGGTIGAQIDSMARRFLWDAGLDYGHGTGHGVGCCLSVHEEAARIDPKAATPLRAGMILSNEPGWYREGDCGIRIESLVLVTDAGAPFPDGREGLCFETITLVPIDRALIETPMLDADERVWLNAYHARVRAAHLEALEDAQDRAWLLAATEPL